MRIDYELKIELLQKQRDFNTSVMEEEVEIDFSEGAKLAMCKHGFRKKGRPFDDRNFLKEVAVDILDCFG